MRKSLVLATINDFDDKQTITSMIMAQKRKYYTINEPKELLVYINENLKPKDIEKQLYGEVFTPLHLVNEMLDKLDDSYRIQHVINKF